MYYNNLENLSLLDSNGDEQSGGGLTELGPFENYYWDVTNTGYWSSTISEHPDYSQVTAFDFSM